MSNGLYVIKHEKNGTYARRVGGYVIFSEEPVFYVGKKAAIEVHNLIICSMRADFGIFPCTIKLGKKIKP